MILAPEASARLAAVGGEALVHHTRRLLAGVMAAGGVTAAYVVGSVASGDARQPVSDLDVILVGDRPRDRTALLALGRRIADIGETSPLRGLEAVLYGADVLAAPSYPLPYELNVNSGPVLSRLVSTGGDEPFWFLLDVAAAGEHAIVLHGPPADALIGPVPEDLVRRALWDALDWHGRREPRRPNAVLNACRAWHWLECGRWLSKSAAGRWAERQPSAPAVVAQALAARLGGRDEDLEPGAVRAVIAEVRRRLDPLAR